MSRAGRRRRARWTARYTRTGSRRSDAGTLHPRDVPADPRSSNGRTAAFGAVNRGSNPCRGATAFLFQPDAAILLTALAFRQAPISARSAVSFASRPLRGLRREVALARVGPQGSGAEPEDLGADSPFSPLDGVAFVDGPVQNGVPNRTRVPGLTGGRDAPYNG